MNANQQIKKFRAQFNVRLFAVLAIMVAVTSSAFATDPDPGDYSTAIGTASTYLGSVFSNNMAAILGLMSIGLGAGIVFRLLKRGAKSI